MANENKSPDEIEAERQRAAHDGELTFDNADAKRPAKGRQPSQNAPARTQDRE
jgi:hypothetical protein